MKTYNTYQEAKIDNPESDIWVDVKGNFGLKEVIARTIHTMHQCIVSDYCINVDEFKSLGYKFIDDDLVVNINNRVQKVKAGFLNTVDSPLTLCTFVLRAAALESQMNIDNLTTQTQEEKEALDSIKPVHLRDYQKGVEQEVEWSGEGLPPVGVECEYKDGDAWYEVKVKYLSEWVIVIEALKSQGKWIDIKGTEISIDHSRFNDLKFRKPESPEEKEERERLEAAYDLFCVCAESDGATPCSFDVFVDGTIGNSKTRFLAIVDKTNYRKEK